MSDTGEPAIQANPPMYRDSAVFNEGAAPPGNPVGGQQGEPAAPAQAINRDQMVSVKVNGQDQEVTLGEALDGYMRNAHFTQQMQQLRQEQSVAKESVDFVKRLEQDPEGTVRLIQDHYQLGSTAQQPGDAYDYDPQPQPDPRVNGLERRIAELQGQMERTAAQQALDNQLATLQTQHGERFDRQRVLDYAVANGMSDINAAWKSMEFDRLSQLEQGLQAQAGERTAAQQALIDQANGVLPGVAPGGSTAATTAGGHLAGEVSTVQDAFLAAKRELGLN